MAFCGPSCAIPSSASIPSIGFGSAGFRGLAPESLTLSPFSLGESSESLGTLAGVIPTGINQIPASEVIIQPPACVIILPGAIMSASCEPVGVGGNAPCAPAGGFGQGLVTGFLGVSLLGSRLGRHYN